VTVAVFLQNKRLIGRESSEEVRNQGEQQFDASVGQLRFRETRNPPGPEITPWIKATSKRATAKSIKDAEQDFDIKLPSPNTIPRRHLRFLRITEDFVGRDAAFGRDPQDRYYRKENENRVCKKSADCRSIPSRTKKTSSPTRIISHRSKQSRSDGSTCRRTGRGP
jgi:hypothetical protein